MKHRTSIKQTSSSDWKQKLREECFHRLDAVRSKLLDAARQQLSNETSHPSSLSHRSTPPLPQNLPTDFRPDRIQHALREIISQSSDPTNSDFDELSSDEYQDLLHALEEKWYEDTLREEADYIKSLEQQDIDAMVESHLGRMALGSADEVDDAVLCPLCQDAWLLERHGIVMCPAGASPSGSDSCHFRVDASIEGLHLRDLKIRLARVLEEHGLSRCRGSPVFQMLNISTPKTVQSGSDQNPQSAKERANTSLIMRCDECDALEIVL